MSLGHFDVFLFNPIRTGGGGWNPPPLRVKTRFIHKIFRWLIPETFWHFSNFFLRMFQWKKILSEHFWDNIRDSWEILPIAIQGQEENIQYFFFHAEGYNNPLPSPPSRPGKITYIPFFPAANFAKGFRRLDFWIIRYWVPICDMTRADGELPIMRTFY